MNESARRREADVVVRGCVAGGTRNTGSPVAGSRLHPPPSRSPRQPLRAVTLVKEPLPSPWCSRALPATDGGPRHLRWTIRPSRAFGPPAGSPGWPVCTSLPLRAPRAHAIGRACLCQGKNCLRKRLACFFQRAGNVLNYWTPRHRTVLAATQVDRVARLPGQCGSSPFYRQSGSSSFRRSRQVSITSSDNDLEPDCPHSGVAERGAMARCRDHPGALLIRDGGIFVPLPG